MKVWIACLPSLQMVGFHCHEKHGRGRLGRSDVTLKSINVTWPLASCAAHLGVNMKWLPYLVVYGVNDSWFMTSSLTPSMPLTQHPALTMS